MSAIWPIRTVVPDRPETRVFLETLACDIRMAGGGAELTRRSGRLTFRARIRNDPKSLLASASSLRARQRDERRALLERAERQQLRERLSPGADFVPETIDPRIVVCDSRAEHDVFAFAQLSQSVPSAPRAGRRIRLLVMDDGQSREALLGVIELASPVFSMECRDRALGWAGTRGKEVRVRGLRRVMDLSTCLALPPYTNLRAGKLLAVLAASDLVVNVFQTRYGQRLAAIVATCATGLHYPQVNRLSIRPGGLYKRVGATAGYSTWIFSRETLAAARGLVQNGAPAGPFGPTHVKGIRLLRSALRKCDLDDEQLLRTDLAKGVYVCDVTGDGVASLHVGSEPGGEAIRTSDGVRWWRERVLAPILDRSDPAKPATSEKPQLWPPVPRSSLGA